MPTPEIDLILDSKSTVTSNDFPFTNSIFIGGEMGWGYMYSTYADQSYSKSTPAGSIQTENGNISLGSTQVNIDMMNHPTGTIRFGVKF